MVTGFIELNGSTLSQVVLHGYLTGLGGSAGKSHRLPGDIFAV
jgi:hypothetical protein